MKTYSSDTYPVGEKKITTEDVCTAGKGFRSCVFPIDVWSYTPPTIGTKYAICEAGGQIANWWADDSKIVSSEIEAKAQISAAHMVLAQIDVISTTSICATKTVDGEVTHAKATRYVPHALTSHAHSHAVVRGGTYNHAVTVGYEAHAAVKSCRGKAATVGDGSHAATVSAESHATTAGNRACAFTSEDLSNAMAAGNYARAITGGYGSHAMTAGECSHSTAEFGLSIAAGRHGRAEAGPNATAVALGEFGRVRGVLGSRLVCAWWKGGEMVGVRTAKITAKSRLRPGRWYWVNSEGKWTEV